MENIISTITLSDLGSVATILLLLITISSYFYVPKILKEKKEIIFRISLTLLIIALLFTLWKWGWLGWLLFKLPIPVWQIIILDIGILAAAVLGVIFLRESTTVLNTEPEYFSLHGARWYIRDKTFNYPPVCEKCLMEMHSRESAYRSHEIWECRECRHQISWSKDEGQLIEDVVARFNALQRREAENNKV